MAPNNGILAVPTRVWLFCIDGFPPILRAFLRGRVPSGAIFGGQRQATPTPHACSDDLPRREPPHGGLSPPPFSARSLWTFARRSDSVPWEGG